MDPFNQYITQIKQLTSNEKCQHTCAFDMIFFRDMYRDTLNEIRWGDHKTLESLHDKIMQEHAELDKKHEEYFKIAFPTTIMNHSSMIQKWPKPKVLKVSMFKKFIDMLMFRSWRKKQNG